LFNTLNDEWYSIYQFCFLKNQLASIQNAFTSINIFYIYSHLGFLFNVHNKSELKRVLVVWIIEWFTVDGIYVFFIQVDWKQKIRFCNKIRNTFIVRTIIRLIVALFFKILLPHSAQAISTTLNYIVSFLNMNLPQLAIFTFNILIFLLKYGYLFVSWAINQPFNLSLNISNLTLKFQIVNFFKLLFSFLGFF
jgi:hypothetical protein